MYKLSVIIVVVIFTCFLGLNCVGSEKSDDPFIEVKTTYSTGIILPKEVSPMVFPQCSRQSPDSGVKTWQVRYDQVVMLEKLFSEYLVRNNIKIIKNIFM